jgi:anti-anti-sigma regulatory factor
MAKTVVQKVESSDPDVTIFKISGTLGFHENKVLAKFFDECSSRGIHNLVIDFSDLGSLGGGCAKIIRGAAESARVHIAISGASRTVLGFLQTGEQGAIHFAPDVEQAIAALRSGPAAESPQETQKEDNPVRETPASEPSVGRHYAADVLTEVDDLLGVPKTACAVADPGPAAKPAPVSDETREIKRKLVRYRALFSLNKEFGRIEDKSRLLDAFLLSTIAQVGVESAAFLELAGDEFVAACWKGFETADPEALNVRGDEVDMGVWLRSAEIFPLAASPISAGARSRLEKWDLPYAAPFLVHGDFRGIVLLGKPIRRALDADSWEFLSMMFDQVAIAYDNSCRLEAQNERTLGLVQSLISMIEHNTASRGTTEMVMDLAYATAMRMHYPEEHLRELLYGTVLRDIGMLNTGSLIVKSPRELLQEEWEIIKQHPVEGAGMLEKMGFSRHACDVVLGHHERYNGEGYPKGLSGAHIPLGARVLSVVESFAAMLHDRPNRPAITREEALNTLEENWGLRYDPEVVKVFIQVVEEEAQNGSHARPRGIDLIKNRGQRT